MRKQIVLITNICHIRNGNESIYTRIYGTIYDFFFFKFIILFARSVQYMSLSYNR